jgi:hypothetical protein
MGENVKNVFWDYECSADIDCPKMSIITDTNLFLQLNKKIKLD